MGGAEHRDQQACPLEHFRLAFESAPLGVVLIDLEGRAIHANPAFARLVGRHPGEIVGHPIAAVSDALQQDVAAAERAARSFSHSTGTTGAELCVERPDGSLVDVLVQTIAQHDAGGELTHLVSFLHDITERKAFEAQLAAQALHDPLTGLPNRTLLLDRLGSALDRAARHRTTAAVLFVDVDRFKLINDSLGHATGDVVLVEVARRLSSIVRATDTVARFAGDEFVVLCEDAGSADEVRALASRLHHALTQPIPIGARDLTMSASIGVALAGTGHERPDQLLRDADTAMYLAKQRGRNRTELFDEGLRTRALQRLDLEQELRRAISREELRLVYQPRIDLTDGRLLGVEALIRWDHPEHGELLPTSFIPIAEETGLIEPIGAWVLRTAAAQAADWRCGDADAVVPSITVNVSAAQVHAGDLSATVRAALAAVNASPAAVGLEVTESAVMHDLARAAATLNELRELGVSVGVDDFGTGYSSLAYLKHLPIDFVKIDRAFVAGLANDRDDEAIVASVMQLARSLGLVGIAEGVETTDQVDRLIDLGCTEAQGFLLCRPLPPDDLLRWMRREGGASGAPALAALR